MTAEVRSLCGLGFPPKPYTQNATESAHSVVKAGLTEKKTVPEFIKHLENMVLMQRNMIKLAFLNQGDFRFKEEYKHLSVEENKYYRMSLSQKEKLSMKINSTPLKPRNEYYVVVVCWCLTSLCHSNGHIETMPAREIIPFTALTRIRSQFLRTQ